jgi:gluconolactonase
MRQSGAGLRQDTKNDNEKREDTMANMTDGLNRRTLLTAASALTATALTARKAHAFEPAERYPDPRIEIIDKKFERLMVFSAGVERIATGMRWCEGPVYFGDARMLVWSDIPANKLMRWDEVTGAVSVFRDPSNNTNGNARDRRGRLISCEHATRRITRTELDGSITVVADRFDGKPLNSPNDVTVKSDNSIWFTDPPYGIGNPYIGNLAKSELHANVYRIDPASGQVTLAAADMERPNGLCFSPDESKLYVVDSRGDPNRHIRVYDVGEGGKLSNGRMFIDGGKGTPDGMRCDAEGNLWCGWGTGSEELDGVRVFAPDGHPVMHIHLPAVCANLCFGGAKRNRLFMAAGQSIYSLFLRVQGAPVV